MLPSLPRVLRALSCKFNLPPLHTLTSTSQAKPAPAASPPRLPLKTWSITPAVEKLPDTLPLLHLDLVANLTLPHASSPAASRTHCFPTLNPWPFLSFSNPLVPPRRLPFNPSPQPHPQASPLFLSRTLRTPPSPFISLHCLLCPLPCPTLPPPPPSPQL